LESAARSCLCLGAQTSPPPTGQHRRTMFCDVSLRPMARPQSHLQLSRSGFGFSVAT
jgi:hypothetical protein